MLLYGIAIGPFGLNWISTEFQDSAPDVSVTALVIVITSSFFAIDISTLRRDALTIGLVGTGDRISMGLSTLASRVDRGLILDLLLILER